jgi:hypothetical protein
MITQYAGVNPPQSGGVVPKEAVAGGHCNRVKAFALLLGNAPIAWGL